MKPPPFRYHQPTSAAEAVAVLGELGDEAKVLAGGQSFVPLLALRMARPEHVVDVNRIPELSGARREGATLTIGATTRHAALIADPAIGHAAPLLAQVAPFIGHFQIRNRGTVGGSVAHADSAAELPAVALALDAEMEVHSAGGTRRISAAKFFEGTFLTALEPDELLTALHFPVWGPGSGFAVNEIARRHGDFALAGAVAGVQVGDGSIVKAAIGMLGMASTPVRASAAERALLSASPAEVDLAEVAHSAVEETDPPDDLHADAAYRRRIGAALVEKALATALQRALPATT